MRLPRLPGATPAAYGVAGALLGAVVLHPLTMAVYWFEFNPAGDGWTAAWQFAASRMRQGFTPRMWLMSALFAALGAGQGVALGALAAAFGHRRRLAESLERELSRSLESLVAGGEGEHLEFKASARWDHRLGRVNRTLETAVVRAVAGLLNHQGGSLLIGVADDGTIIGLAPDYATLHRPDRDGYQQWVSGVLLERLGPVLSRSVHVVFHEKGGRDVCRLLVEPGAEPAYVREKGTDRFVLRVGNATREVELRDAVAYLTRRWPSRR